MFIEEKLSDKLLVIFSGVNATTFMGYKLFSTYNVNKLFIRDPNKSWYNGEIKNLSTDADDLLIKIKYITDKFELNNITMFGSSMGGYAAILFGVKLKVANVITFGPQIILNPKMPNNPSSMKNITYDNLHNILDENHNTNITIYCGSEEIVDIYNLWNLKKYKKISLVCIYGSSHNVMYHLTKINLIREIMNLHIIENYRFKYLLPQFDIFSNDKLLEYIRESVISFYEEEYEKSFFYISKVVICEPSWSAGWAFLGKIQLKLNLLDDALISLNKSFEIFYNTEHPHYDAGMIYFEKHEYEKAENEFKVALQFSSILKNEYLLKLSITLRKQGKFDEAIKYLKMIEQKNSKSFAFLFQMGRLNFLKENYATAKDYFERSIKINPKNETANNFYNMANDQLNKVTNNLPKYKLFTSGDCILARRMHYFYEKYGKNWILGDLPSITKECNVVMTNLKSVITNQGNIVAKGEKNPYVYRASPKLVEILLDLNINIVTTANNQSINYGESGLEQQNRILNQLEIAVAGSGMNYDEAKAPQYIQVGEVTLAFISTFTFLDSDKYCATNTQAGIFHLTDKDKILEELTQLYKEANKYADLIIFSPHWNKNWTNTPSLDEKKLAREIIDIGYDAIIGHSSHILHGMELYKNKPIIYDMGTFLVDNISGHEELNNSACFVLTFDKTGFEKVEIYPIVLDNGRVSLPKNNTEVEKLKSKYINLTKKISDNIFFGDIDNKLVVEFYNKGKGVVKKENPKNLYIATKIKKNINQIDIEKSNIILDTLPIWSEKNQLNVIFENKFKLIATKIPEVFLQGTSFLIENLIETYESLSTDRWEVHIVGKHIDLLDNFEEFHPISNGIHNPIHWKKGELIIDHSVIRVKSNLVEGTYKLYFGFYNFNKKIHLIADIIDKNKYLVYIGNIKVVSSGVPNLVSGIDWNGKYK